MLSGQEYTQHADSATRQIMSLKATSPTPPHNPHRADPSKKAFFFVQISVNILYASCAFRGLQKYSGATFAYEIPESLPGVRATSETGTKLLQSFESAMRLSIIMHVTLGLQKPQH